MVEMMSQDVLKIGALTSDARCIACCSMLVLSLAAGLLVVGVGGFSDVSIGCWAKNVR
jgi:hypothetical protein